LFAGLFADRNTIFYFIGAGVEKCIFYYFLKIKKIKYTVKIPTMLKGRGFDAFERVLQKPFQGRIIKNFFQGADIIFTQDNLSKQVLSEKYGIDPFKVRILLNGIEPHCLRKIKKVQNIIFVGRILREKGVYEMFDFAKESINSSKDWRIIMIGDGPELENLKKMAGMQGVDNIKFYGYIEAVKKYYEEADLFLFPSYREGFPNVVLEAMSHGVPVLSSKVGSLPEIFVGNKHIFFLNEDEVNGKSICNRVISISDDIGLLNCISNNAFELINNQLHIKDTYKKFCNILKGLV
jgi:glycosyltransferase involved in cell wall biosynthesis